MTGKNANCVEFYPSKNEQILPLIEEKS